MFLPARALPLTAVALGLALPAAASDQGNVVLAVKAGALQEDVLLDFAAAPASRFRVARDGAKTALGASTLAPLVTTPAYTDAGAVPAAAGSPFFYQIDGIESCGSCTTFMTPVDQGPLGEPALREASGIAASRAHPGVLWAHNDSGDSARFFALASDGTALGEFRLAAGARNVDWEDVALGPCPSGTCLYFGDHGDNDALRSNCALYRVPEPAVEVGSPVGVVSDWPWELFPFSYPDGPRDAEALMVHPVSGDVYIASKIAAPARGAFYKFPQPLVAGVPTVLTYLAELPASFSLESPVTAGDIHPCEPRLLIRTFDYGLPFFQARLFEVVLGGAGPFDDIFTIGSWQGVPVATESQGEAVGWAGDGLGHFTTSEGGGEPVWFSSCQ